MINTNNIDIRYDPATKTLIIDNYIPPEDNPSGDYSGILNGFTYNGIHSSVYHVDYIPDASDLWFASPDWDMYDSDIAWHHGGYYYGNAVKNRDFKLKCFYEEVNRKKREDMRKWLHRDTSGILMFDDLPFVYWKVRPVSSPTGQEYIDSGYFSGLFDITFRAYEPFGYLVRKYNSTPEEEEDEANDYCDLIKESEMPAAPTTASRTFNVYNPGREVCGLNIQMSGTVSNPVEFLNETNGSRCIIQRLPTNNLVLDIDSDYATIYTHPAGTAANSELGYVYHDRGYVSLNPGTNSIRIMEQNNSGSWVTPTTLQLTSLSIDYRPRIL